MASSDQGLLSRLVLPSTAGGVVEPATVGRGELAFHLLPGGGVRRIMAGPIPISLYQGNPQEGGPTNLYLRVRSGDRLLWTPLLGAESGYRHVEFGPARMTVRRHWASFAIELTLQVAGGDRWSWQLSFRNEGDSSRECDVVCVHDVGLSNAGNESYMSQYVDHTVLRDEELGHVLCCRQNLGERGGHPWVLFGCRSGTCGFVTDGLDFYGLTHRATGRPEALSRSELGTSRRQGEFSLVALQSRPVCVAPGKTGAVEFFAVYTADHPQPSSPDDLGRIPCAPLAARPVSAGMPRAPNLADLGLFSDTPLFPTDELSGKSIADRWPERCHEERDADGRILSFFGTADRHVVLKAKELLQERATGAILRTRQEVVGDACLLSSTSYMRGAFLSQVALGNLSLNIALTISRDPLHAMRAAGLRIFVQRAGRPELLGVPSAFENTPTGCRWLYLSGDDCIEVSVWAGQETRALYLQVESALYRQFTVFAGLAMGDANCQPSFADVAEVTARAVVLRPAPGSRFAERYPDAEARLVPEDASVIQRIGGDHLLYADGVSRGSSGLVMETGEASGFRLAVTGRLLAEDSIPPHEELFAGPDADAAAANEAGAAFHRQLLGMELTGQDDRLGALQTVLPWLVQNALVHLTAPHGLEQYLGAAWGTRDVCQGSAEMLLALGHHDEARKIVRTVFANQHALGDWRQWFMFDRNGDIRAGDAHGDVVFWPLRMLCEYIETTNDLAFLDQEVPYFDDQVAETIGQHVDRALAAIRGEFVPGTALVRYGHGDWNDSLQPADPELASRMVSSWTVALCCQTLRGLAELFERGGRPEQATELRDTLAQAEKDFRRHLVHEGTVCGFAVFDAAGQARPLLHPLDRETGIHYRLLPMIRGIISDVFDPDEANHHADLIEQHLVAPDGARLMDRPPQYRGGLMRIFQRGETATFFGREIGIMYVHAHLRYLEAMARLGRSDVVLDGLMKIVPVDLPQRLPQAVIRQSNAYFSSSDAAFADREQADREYDRVKDGSIAVKGGWRIYSSGPGLVLQLVVRHLLGIRFHYGDIVFDPSLPSDLDALQLDWHLCDRPVSLHYRRTGNRQVVLNGEVLPARTCTGRYRDAGLAMPRVEFAARLCAEGNEIAIEF